MSSSSSRKRRRRKILVFDGQKFWKNAYVHQRAKALCVVNVPDEQISDMTNMAYLDLPLDVRYEIETSLGIDRSKLNK